MSSKKGDTCLDYLQEMAYHSTKVQFMGSQAPVHSPVGNATSSPKMTSGRAILHISVVSLHPISDHFNHRLSLSLIDSSPSPLHGNLALIRRSSPTPPRRPADPHLRHLNQSKAWEPCFDLALLPHSSPSPLQISVFRAGWEAKENWPVARRGKAVLNHMRRRLCITR
jgi:hypothetical protein